MAVNMMVPCAIIGTAVLIYSIYKLLKNESNDDVPAYAPVHGGAHTHVGWRRGEDPDHRPNSYYDDDTGNNNSDHQSRQRQPRDFQSFGTPSNLNNNHDQDKRPYHSKEDAEVVVQRMKRQGHDPNDTLVSYHNTELGTWFVGNNKKYY